MPRFRVNFLCNEMPSLTALYHVRYYILILVKKRKSTCRRKLLTFVWCYTKFLFRAGVTQLVEYKLPKLGVAGSNPVARSIRDGQDSFLFLLLVRFFALIINQVSDRRAYELTSLRFPYKPFHFVVECRVIYERAECSLPAVQLFRYFSEIR